MPLYTVDDWKQDTRRARAGLPLDCPVCGGEVGFGQHGVLCGECRRLPAFGAGAILSAERFVALVNVARSDRLVRAGR